MISNITRLLVVIFLLTTQNLAWAVKETVTLPLTIDYPLLRSLVVATAFTDPEESRVLVDENQGCTRITVSQPQYAALDERVSLETRVSIKAGTFLAGKCRVPITWSGFVELYQIPGIEADTWQLSFETVDSKVLGDDRRPAKVAGFLWNFIKSHVYDYLNQITIDLAPPVLELKSFLMPLFPAEIQSASLEMLKSMRPDKAYATPTAVRVDILAEVATDSQIKPEEPSQPLSEAQLEKLVDTWEAWDAFFVQMINVLAEEPLTEQDRQVLFEVLLDTRHRFVEGLADHSIKTDFVRVQFVEAWTQLSPIFKRHLSKKPSDNILGYLAFFTSGDALAALDRMGPAMGIEMSRDGLLRLIHMLNQDLEEIEYEDRVDHILRDTLGLEPLPAAEEPAIEMEGIEIEPEEIPAGKDAPPREEVPTETDKPADTGKAPIEKRIKNWAAAVFNFLTPAAWAGQGNSLPTLKELRRWLVTKNDPVEYLQRVKKLLDEAASKVLAKGKIEERHHAQFRKITLSTAWQESCFRQFWVRKNKLTYLRSYNGSSVGIMQINERVWRGLYSLSRLRWNIEYNALAGCEILDQYLRKYALRKITPGESVDDDTLAGVVYAMYNGGPSQFKKYMQRKKSAAYYDSDKLYREKHSWVKEGQWDNINICWVGG
jgi:hypothetical protein